MWDEQGIECLEDVTEHHPDNRARAHLFNTIKTSRAAEPSGLDHQVSMMRMRARVNGQRHYEIYVFTSEDTVELDDITQWHTADLQSFVDWVRINHASCLWSNRATRKPAIV
jgi:hypothetical protein